ncbi:enoyl-CoA hydratase/isomerase family protein [Defluviimonas sp. WL0002]|uniref:Enoyl-CoA hydratase/isomerase family protein n=1 Tax=Albidovulum marisflavi TaxID=2984159 RepID=A0ABT2ZGV4_9RHOB|nr:enoyl-CoA hydratase/isomerase family protein [Defluviimonas sp. WL0002]MCV2870349.1 enoyl-CoA hydratase/isomerase family protein [Defluviimonas sp. WL0002]
MQGQGFGLTVDDGIAILKIDRPEKLNALDAGMVDTLSGLCRQIEHREDVDVVILTGTGKAFCAGGDIVAWSLENPERFGRHWVRDGHDAFDRLARLRQPVIAVLNGHALGGGLELAACADYRIAEAHVKIGQPEAGLGIIAGWSGTQRAVRRFGAQWVRRMALFGEVLTAEDARAAGIIDAVAETGAGLDLARNLAARVLSRSPVASELTKMLVNAAEGEETGRVLESLAGRIAAASDDLGEGISAFKAKRKPNFGRKGKT